LVGLAGSRLNDRITGKFTRLTIRQLVRILTRIGFEAAFLKQTSQPGILMFRNFNRLLP
jgi:hypothetical protein